MRSSLVVVVALLGGVAQADAPRCTTAEAQTTKARLTADSVEACFDDQTCWRLPLATKKWEPATAWVDGVAAAPVATTTVTACTKADACKDVEFGPAAAATADGALVAVIDADHVQVFDTKAKKVVATIKGAASSVRFLGTSLLVDAGTAPQVTSRLYAARTGKQLAAIGGAAQALDADAVVELAKAGTYAFGGFGGDKVFIHDAATGAQHVTIAVANPKSHATIGKFAVFAKTGTVLVTLRGDAMSGATLIDTKSRNGQRIALPLCDAAKR